ncbi:MAG: hypothetical protein D6748_13385, partial [Calditrichaeota bacterium]
MKIIQFTSVMLLLTIFTNPLLADITIKPHIGYFFPRMGDVNSKIETDILTFRDIFGEPIPQPGKISGNPMYGAQIEYHLNEDYFLNVNVAYYQDKSNVFHQSFTDPSLFLNYKREVQFYDVMFNLLYFINYNSWRRFNKYMGLGIGVVLANAHSVTETNHPALPLNSRGDFTGNSLSAIISVGGKYRLTTFSYLWGEIGLEYGNMGPLDGKVTTLDHPEKRDAITESSFDFTGIYLRIGIGMKV